MPFSLQDIDTKLGAYAAFKIAAEEADKKVKARMDELMADPELNLLKKALSDAKFDEGQARTELDNWALAMNLADKTKHPHDAILVSDKTSLVYDSALAVAWCMGKQLAGLLTVKKAPFEAILESEAKENKGVFPSFVRVEIAKIVSITKPERYIPKYPESELPDF